MNEWLWESGGMIRTAKNWIPRRKIRSKYPCAP